jgi:hypothetical protein
MKKRVAREGKEKIVTYWFYFTPSKRLTFACFISSRNTTHKMEYITISSPSLSCAHINVWIWCWRWRWCSFGLKSSPSPLTTIYSKSFHIKIYTLKWKFSWDEVKEENKLC